MKTLLAFSFVIAMLGSCGRGSGSEIKSFDPPTFTEARSYHISAGDSQVCVTDDVGIKCWGFPFDRVPEFQDTESLSVGENFSCALGDGLVKCWGNNSSRGLDVPKTLKAPISVATGRWHACAIVSDSNSNAVTCWGVTELGKPTFLQI